MRAAKLLAVLAIAALGIGSFSAVALAGESLKPGARLKVGVGFCDPEIPWEQAHGCGSHGQNPTFDNSGLVIAQVRLYQRGREWKPCFVSRSMRLQLLNRNGVVLTTLDGSTTPPPPGLGGHTDTFHGIWTLSGQLPTTLPAGTNYVRAKAKKRTVNGKNGKEFVCLAAVSKKVAIPAV